MKRENLEKYLGKSVKVKLFDGEETQGYLQKTGENVLKDNPSLYYRNNYYFVSDSNLNAISCVFRTSHVTKIKNIVIKNYLS